MFPSSISSALSYSSIVKAQASHVYSYTHGFKGFAAKLTERQASEMASKSFSFSSCLPPLLAFQLKISPLSVLSSRVLIMEVKNFVIWKSLTAMPGVVSVFPNSKRRLHTTHSWDFMGLEGEEAMEIPGYSTKNQENVIIGFIDTGQHSFNSLSTSILVFFSIFLSLMVIFPPGLPKHLSLGCHKDFLAHTRLLLK